MRSSRFLIIIPLLCISMQASALGLTLQGGANHGLFAAGFRHEIGLVQLGLTYGVTPSNVGARLTTQVNGKLNFRVFDYLDWTYYLGTGLIVNHSSFTQFSLPSKYPRGYYPPDAYYFTLQQVLYFHRFFIEISIIDYYLEVWARNEFGTVRLIDTASVWNEPRFVDSFPGVFRSPRGPINVT